MAFDGLFIHALCNELNSVLAGAKINKIAQPEKEELLIAGKSTIGNFRLLISANASLPLIYLTDDNKPSPATAPGFCMLLRKHIGAGRILSVEQIGYERVISIKIQHLNEMGDVSFKCLKIEIMGKHSNIIFCDENDIILDSIKHISLAVSSVREVLPGRKYFIPAQEGKISPSEVNPDTFNEILKKPYSVSKAIYTSIIGISPIMASEIAFNAGIDADASTSTIDNSAILYESFSSIVKSADSVKYEPIIYYENGKPTEFSFSPLNSFKDNEFIQYSTLSECLAQYFSSRNLYNNIKNKSADLRKIVSTHIERTAKKIDIQTKQLEDTKKKDKFRIYGELLNTYGYSAVPGDKSITVVNYYDNQEITIPLDETKTAAENAQHYFDKYNKLKRTAEAMDKFLEESEEELKLLLSIEAALNIAETDADLSDIKNELINYGFIKKSSGNKQRKTAKNKPLHFIDENGFHIYVGKNNFQNDELTFKFATGNDWWFHTKKIHGSHVIVKADNKELPDSTFEYAASLAAFYSMGRDSEKVEIDYLQKKNVKKPAKAVAGFVVYYTNYSMMAKPDKSHVTLVSD